MNDEDFNLNSFDLKSLQKRHLANHAEQIILSTENCKKFPQIIMICLKMNQIYPQFKDILEKKLFDVFAKGQLSNKQGIFISKLFNVNMIRWANIERFMNHYKDRNDFQSTIQFFKVMRKKIKEKDIGTYIKYLDWFYELNFNPFLFKRDCVEILEEFYKDLQTVDDEKLEGVFPSFKWMINTTTLNKPSEVIRNFFY